MRAEILRSIEKRLLKQPLDQAELLAIAIELQLVLGYAQHRLDGFDPAREFRVYATNTDGRKMA